MNLLSRDELMSLFDELAAELTANGCHGHVFVVGGAAIALAYNTRRSTRDLDAVFEPKSVVYAAAGRVAEHNGLPADWLNDAVKGFLPGEDPNATTVFDRPGLSVRVASPRYLFAMKAIAARVDRDYDDLIQLYRLSGFTSADDALDCVAEYYSPHLIPPRTEFVVRELLG
jgi:Nucleotidyltransferase of unknown function (DUF6036)